MSTCLDPRDVILMSRTDVFEVVNVDDDDEILLGIVKTSTTNAFSTKSHYFAKNVYICQNFELKTMKQGSKLEECGISIEHRLFISRLS